MKMIKITRFIWSGHIVGVEDNVPCRKINFFQPEGSRKKGVPRLTWLDSVLKGLKTLEENALWNKARDRHLCSEIIKEAKTHNGLQRQKTKRNEEA